MSDDGYTNYIVATIKSWNIEEFARRVSELPGRWLLVTDPDSLSADVIRSLRPRYVFLPHWSWIVPDEILAAAECVCFHMTDVPFGRGGSPLQNLIVRGHTETRLSALRMVSEPDAGPVYMKRALSLKGSAEEILVRCTTTIFDMIGEIVTEHPKPTPQIGAPVVFSRRHPSESRLSGSGALEAVYDHIRMLDAEGYPAAFLDYGDFRVEFHGARLDSGKVQANATFLIAGRKS